jgi:hypothetical protein
MWEWDNGGHLSNLLAAAAAATQFGGNARGRPLGRIGEERQRTLIASKSQVLDVCLTGWIEEDN